MKYKIFFVTVALLAMVLCSGGFVRAQAINSSLLLADLQAQIDALMQQITQLKAQQAATTATGISGTVGTGWCHVFSNSLAKSDTDANKNGEVSSLQTALTKQGFSVSKDAAGKFGNATAAAIVAFQKKYGISQTGTVGPQTKAKLNSLYKCVANQTPAPSPTPASATVNYTTSNYSMQDCYNACDGLTGIQAEGFCKNSMSTESCDSYGKPSLQLDLFVNRTKNMVAIQTKNAIQAQQDLINQQNYTPPKCPAPVPGEGDHGMPKGCVP